MESQTSIPPTDTTRLPKRIRLKQWAKKHRAILIILGIVLAISVVVGMVLYQKYQKSGEVTLLPSIKITKKPPVKYYSPLTGIEVADTAATTAPVTAIMMENSPSARPQSGIKQAEVVYEAIAEGGITRYLLLYQQNKPQLIGPVRSLRQYFLDWATPYDASIAHVGGSAGSLQNVRNGQYVDLDQFFNGGSYWRSTDRYAPHNVYTKFDNIDTLNKQKNHTESHVTSFSRIDGAPAKTTDATRIVLNFSSSLYNTSYIFDATTNSYARQLAGAAHTDREEGPITPHVVIALHVNERTIMEDGYREHIDTTGSGEADIFQNGTVIKATWQKADQKSALKLVDAAGKDIALVRGQTWIAAIPNEQGSVSWQ